MGGWGMVNIELISIGITVRDNRKLGEKYLLPN